MVLNQSRVSSRLGIDRFGAKCFKLRGGLGDLTIGTGTLGAGTLGAIALFTLLATASPVRGQSPITTMGTDIVYDVTSTSVLISGCVGPSTCQCFAVFISPISGTVRLSPTAVPAGPLQTYLITADLIRMDGPTPIPLSGTGSIVVDLTFGQSSMTLDLDLNGDGVDEQFESEGFVSGASNFPTNLDVAVYAPQPTIPPSPLPVLPCTYDGFELFLQRAAPLFIRGDLDGDGVIALPDAIAVLQGLFGTLVWDCPSAADVDDDGSISLGDAIMLLNTLFIGSVTPAVPYPDCGADPTPDPFQCIPSPFCAP